MEHGFGGWRGTVREMLRTWAYDTQMHKIWNNVVRGTCHIKPWSHPPGQLAVEWRNENGTVPSGDTREQKWVSHHSMGKYRSVKNRQLTHNWPSSVMLCHSKKTKKKPCRNESTDFGEHIHVIHPYRRLVWVVISSGVSGVRPGPGLAWLSLQDSHFRLCRWLCSCLCTFYIQLNTMKPVIIYHNITLKGQLHNTWVDEGTRCVLV